MPGVTPTYGLPYQELGDPPHGPNLSQDLAQGVEAELQRIDTMLTALWQTTTTTSGAVASTGFSVTNFSGRKVGGVTTITTECQRTGAAVSEVATNSGNIGDTAMVTLPAGWRPPELMEAIWDSGVNDGGATINTAGVITLRTTSGSAGIGTGDSPRVSASWISGNV